MPVPLQAIVERLDVKQSVFQEASKACKASCILASNTMTLSIGDIAAKSKDPEVREICRAKSGRVPRDCVASCGTI